MPFRPSVGSMIQIGQTTLTFSEHPSAKGMPYGQAGRKATVYQVVDEQSARHALKVFTRVFQTEQTARGAKRLEAFADLPGLEVCRRLVINPEDHSELLQQHPELLYCVVMPWVEGNTWQECVLGCMPVTEAQSLEMAKKLSIALSEMEKAGLAHCDLSGANVIISFTSVGIDVMFVDVEDMYGPEFEKPSSLPIGTPGFNHKGLSKGSWFGNADRFSGAVLLVEMLAWCDDRVRRIAYGDTFFDPKEMQSSSERYQVILRALRDHWGNWIGDLFAKAWYSETLEQCPSLNDWNRTIQAGGELPLEEILAEIEKEIDKANWEEVVALCDRATGRYGYHLEVGNWKARTEKVMDLNRELTESWKLAISTGQTKDWQVCLASLRSLVYYDRDRPVYHSQIAFAQQEFDAALMIDQVEQCIQKDLWRDAQSLLDNTQTQSPRFAQLKAQVDLQVQKQVEFEQQRTIAMKSIANEDWGCAIAACQKGLALGLDGCVLQPLLEKAYAGRERSQRIQQGMDEASQLLADQAWEQAQEKAELLLKEYPDAQMVQVFWQDVQQKLKHVNGLARARSLIAAKDYQGALAQLQSIPFSFLDAADLEMITRANLSWQEQLETARRTYDARKVLNLAEHVPPGGGVTGGLRKWAEEELALEEAILAARDRFDLDTASDLLIRLPKDHPEHSRLNSWLEDQCALQKQIEQAQRANDGETVEKLVSSQPDGYPHRMELLQWAKEEIERKANLRTWKEKFQWRKVLQVAEAAPFGYPDREELIIWCNRAREAHEQVDVLCERYDLEGLEAALPSLEEDDPRRGEAKVWLTREQNRVRQVEAVCAAGNAEEIRNLLAEAPGAFPQREELLVWADEQEKINQEIEAIYSTYDLKLAQGYLEKLSLEDPRYQALSTWYKQESARAEQINQGLQTYQYQQVLNALASVSRNYPNLDEARNWALGWIQAEEEIDQALAEENLQVLDAYLKQLPQGQPKREPIERLKEEIAQRINQLAGLQKAAAQAMKRGQWEVVMNSCRQALVYKEAGSEFREMMAAAEQGLLQARQTRQVLEQIRSLLQQGHMEQALRQCHLALQTDPQNEEARLLFLRIREQMVLQAKKLDQAGTWRKSARIWASLQEHSPLPAGAAPGQSPDPFLASITPQVNRARQMRNKEIGRLLIVAVIVVVVVALVVSLVYLLLMSGSGSTSWLDLSNMLVDVFGEGRLLWNL